MIVEAESISKILNNFHEKQSKDNVEMKEHMIKSAAKLLASDIRSKDYDPSVYFAIDDLDNETQLDQLPASLITFLLELRPRRSKELNMPMIAGIGQSIMHLAAPHYLPPIHVALASQVHSRSGCELLVESLHKFGFTTSAKTVRGFERSSALQDTFTAANEPEIHDLDESEVVKIELTFRQQSPLRDVDKGTGVHTLTSTISRRRGFAQKRQSVL